MRFSANIVTGSGRGKKLGSPTMNLDLNEVPHDLTEGVYACYAVLGDKRQAVSGKQHAAVMHYGPRPTFDGSRSCEVHLLTEKSEIRPVPRSPKGEVGNPKSEKLTVEVVERLRDVEKFESESALKAQIAEDIRKAKEILNLPPTT